MANTPQPAYQAYTVIKREGQDDFWLNIGAAFFHADREGINVILQALPLGGKIVLRPPKQQDDKQNDTPANNGKRGQDKSRHKDPRKFVGAEHQVLAGSDISKQTGMLSGTLYPILMRLERARWLESEWENLDEGEAGRPRRRFYRFTGLGYNKSRAALAELGVPNGRIEWNS
jgi:Transcriptional regulator PadR-like family